MSLIRKIQRNMAKGRKSGKLRFENSPPEEGIEDGLT